MFLSNNRTENTHLFHEETITLERITDVMEMDPNGDIEAFCYFFDHLVPCVAGGKVWTQREKANKLIPEANKVVSVLDKAFTILALKTTGRGGITLERQYGLTQGLVTISTWAEQMRPTLQVNKRTAQKGVKHEIRGGVLGKITHAAVRRRSTFKTPHRWTS
jgi:hypothetical protein